MQTEGLRCHSQTEQASSLLRGRAMRIPQLRKARTIVRRWCEETELGYGAVTWPGPRPALTPGVIAREWSVPSSTRRRRR